MLRASILVADPKSKRALPLAFLLPHNRLYTLLRCGRLHRHPATLSVAVNPGETTKARHRETPRLRHLLHFSFLLTPKTSTYSKQKNTNACRTSLETSSIEKLSPQPHRAQKISSSKHDFGEFNPRSLPQQSMLSLLSL